ncbi:BspA family leucine-rich repeat surface protein [Methanobrevibacter sp.]|uniref:BspA family leucine-rich repeat surface protein n=1 Tax=Methanobrevibacter sp. TaxID=66852 RepID=UPI00388E8E9D
MAIYKGDKKVIALYKGDKKIIKRYKGTQVVFDSAPKNNNTLSFEFTGDTTTYKLNDTAYTATSSPYSTTLDNLGIETLTSCNGTFSGSSISELISFPDTSNVTYMNYMFSGCKSLTTLDVSNFDTSKVTNMNQMFANCNSLTELDLSNFNTSAVTNMSWMFNGCRGLTTLDISNFDISKVTQHTYIFNSCSSLNKLILGEVSQEQYDWWYQRLVDAGIQDKVTIEYSIV